MSEQNKIKLKTKLDEFKQKRKGETKQLVVTVSDDPSLNFQHTFNEMKQLCETHKLSFDEVNALGSQLQWVANQLTVNQKLNQLYESIQNGFTPKPQTFEDKEAEKLKKEKDAGIKRVGPSE